MAESEIFPVEEFQDFKITLKNKGVDNVVEFVRK